MANSSKLVIEIARGLPRQPIEAIAVFAERVNNRIIKGPASAATETDYIGLIAFLDRFTKRFGIDIKVPSFNKETTYYQKLSAYITAIRSLGIMAVEEELSTEIDNLITEYEGASGETFGIARLNDDEKRKILQHLEKARQIVEDSKLSDRKKNALFERLADLIREVSTFGTRTDRFFALAGDLGFVLGDMAEKAKPFFNEVKEILKIITRSRARQEGISLPPGDEVLKLSRPSDFEIGEE